MPETTGRTPPPTLAASRARQRLASLKAAYDGLVSAGLLVDDDSRHLRQEMLRLEVDSKAPRVEIVVERAA